MDRRISELSQRAGVLESLASGENALFRRGRHPVGRLARTGRSIAPLNAVQALTGGPGNPSLNGAETDTVLMGDLPSASPAVNRGNDGTTLFFDRVFLPSSFLRGSFEETFLFLRTLAEAKPVDNQTVEADGVWKAAEYGAFPHPLENAARFPQLPQPPAATSAKKSPTKTPLARPGVADSQVTWSC